MKENKFGAKFTQEERKLIAELYPTHSKKQISKIIGKELTSGALQKIKKAFGITTKPYDEGKKIIQEHREEIKRLAEEGWNNEDICKKLNIPLKTKFLFYKHIEGFSCGSYRKGSPEVQAEMVNDYVNNLLSVYDLEKKYEIDTHGVQDILKKHGVLRNFRETHRLKREAGLGIYKNSKKRKYARLINGNFTRGLRREIRQKFDNKCLICGAEKSFNNRKLDVHHIYPYKLCLKNEVENLVPLCKNCHKNVHKKMSVKGTLLPQVREIYNQDKTKLIDWFIDSFIGK